MKRPGGSMRPALFAGLCLLSLGCSDATSERLVRSAAVTGQVTLVGGIPGANTTVLIGCAGTSIDTLVPTATDGRYRAKLTLSTDRTSLDCLFSVPTITRPRIQLDTTVVLFGAGFYPQQIIDLTEYPAP